MLSPLVPKESASFDNSWKVLNKMDGKVQGGDVIAGTSSIFLAGMKKNTHNTEVRIAYHRAEI
jgi:hypothetical protein